MFSNTVCDLPIENTDWKTLLSFKGYASIFLLFFCGHVVAHFS